MMAAPIPSPPFELLPSLEDQLVPLDATPLSVSVQDIRPECLAAIVSDMNNSLAFSVEEPFEPM